MKINKPTLLLATLTSVSAFAEEKVSSPYYICRPCPANYFMQNGECTPCPAGQISAPGSVTCTKACVPGTYLKNGKCELCPIGKYQDAAGATSCKSCPAGTFQDAPGQTSCKSCPAGTYDPYKDGGRSKCSKCPAGYFCEGGSADAKKCLGYKGKWAPEGSSSCLDCEPIRQNRNNGRSMPWVDVELNPANIRKLNVPIDKLARATTDLWLTGYKFGTSIDVFAERQGNVEICKYDSDHPCEFSISKNWFEYLISKGGFRQSTNTLNGDTKIQFHRNYHCDVWMYNIGGNKDYSRYYVHFLKNIIVAFATCDNTTGHRKMFVSNLNEDCKTKDGRDYEEFDFGPAVY